MTAISSMDKVPTKPRGHSISPRGETTPRVAGWLRSSRGRVNGSTYTKTMELDGNLPLTASTPRSQAACRAAATESQFELDLAMAPASLGTESVK